MNLNFLSSQYRFSIFFFFIQTKFSNQIQVHCQFIKPSTMLSKNLIQIAFLFLLIAIKPSFGLKCLDEDEREVDWWVFYKIPKQSTKGSANGDIYVYATSRTIKIEQNWIHSTKLITGNESIIAKTLNQIYLNSQMFNYIQYNDELPASIKSNTGKIILYFYLNFSRFFFIRIISNRIHLFCTCEGNRIIRFK